MSTHLQNARRSYIQPLPVTHVMITGLEFKPDELIDLQEWASDCQLAVMDVMHNLDILRSQGHIKLQWFYVEREKVRSNWFVLAD